MELKLKIASNNNEVLKAYRPLDELTIKSLRNYYRIGLTYSSNALEGNSLTESETRVVIEDGLTIEGKPLRDVYEAVGHAKAYDHLYSLLEKPSVEEADILLLHKYFFQQIDETQAGKYREVPVFISGSEYGVTPPQKIALGMKRFISWYNANEGKMHPVKMAALTHQRFVFIHPFIDGNGRLARLLMNLVLLRNDYTIAIIPLVLRHTYIALLEKAHSNVRPFVEFIADCVIYTQNDLLRLLRESGGVKKAVGGVKIYPDKKNGGVKNKSELIYEIIAQFPGINAPAIAQHLGLSLRSTQRYIKQLSEQGLIIFKGAPKSGGYFITI
jgi:Fic family protein